MYKVDSFYYREKDFSYNMFGNEADDMLIQRWIDFEDEEAFDQLFERYRKKITSYAARTLTNYEDDVFQHCVLKFIENPENFKNKDNLGAYFFTVACNYIRKEYFSKSKNNITETSRELEDAIPSEVNYEDKIIWHQNKELLREAINLLPLQYKEVFVLLIENDFKPREIAQILELSPKQVSNRINNGYCQITEYIKRKIRGKPW